VSICGFKNKHVCDLKLSMPTKVIFKICTFNSMDKKEVKKANFCFTVFFAFLFRVFKSILLTQLTRDGMIYFFPSFIEKVIYYYFYLMLFVFLFSLHTEQTKHLQTTEM